MSTPRLRETEKLSFSWTVSQPDFSEATSIPSTPASSFVASSITPASSYVATSVPPTPNPGSPLPKIYNLIDTTEPAEPYLVDSVSTSLAPADSICSTEMSTLPSFLQSQFTAEQLNQILSSFGEIIVDKGFITEADARDKLGRHTISQC